MSVAVATAVTNHRLEAEEQQLALCRSVINNRLYFDDGKKRNQWAHCPSKSSVKFNEILRDYHKKSTSRSKAAELLLKDHGLIVSERTVARRWKDMGLKASNRQERELSPQEIVNIVAEELEMDPEGTMGQNLVKHRIAMRTGMHLKQKTVSALQGLLDPEAKATRWPGARKIRRVPLDSNGPNETWCCDGHDKLVKYGFAIWGIRDKFSRKWLGLWVIPSNRSSSLCAYLWLTLVRKLGGMPPQTSTDCGTENTLICGLAHALNESNGHAREGARPTPHIFLRSVHHTPIERGWLDLRRSLGENFHHFWQRGADVYKDDAIGRVLLRWLWPDIIQRELDKFCTITNARRVRKQKDKKLPSGVSPEYSYSCPDLFGGHQCLQSVDSSIIDELLLDLEGEKEALTDWQVPEEFQETAETVLGMFGFERKSITILNAWMVFSAIYAHLVDLDPNELGISLYETNDEA